MLNSISNFPVYWVPVLSSTIWWAMLISLMALWAHDGFPQYNPSKPDQFILYISDIAAGRYKVIFVCGSASQGLLFVVSLACELYLRHTGRLRRYFHAWAVWCTSLSLLFAVVGQLGILFVAIFDTAQYPDTHMSMLVVYIVFIGVSAVFNVMAYYSLGRSHLTRAVQLSLWLKIAWFVVESVLAVAFVASQQTHKNVPAVLEWVISVVYPLYQLIIAYDVWPANNKAAGHYPRRNSLLRLGLQSVPDLEFEPVYIPRECYNRECYKSASINR